MSVHVWVRLVRIGLLSRAGGKKECMCENMNSNNNAPTVLSQFTLCVCTFERERNEIGFMRSIFYVCTATELQNEKHKNESSKIAIQIHCAHKAFK